MGKKSPKRKQFGFVDLDTDVPSLIFQRAFNFFQNEIVGQDRSARYLIDALELYQAGLRNPDRPIFVGLLAGPSGVGKTLLARVLAKYLFGDYESFTKIRCVEYVNGHEVSNLSGAPPGYIGYTTDPRQLKLSQFNIDKFDFRKKLYSGQLGENILKRMADIKTAYLLKKKDLEEELQQLSGKEDFSVADEDRIHEIKNRLESIDNQVKSWDRALKKGQDYFRGIDESLLYQYYENWAGDLRMISVVLFDEIEKASNTVYNQLLEIMGSGQLEVGGSVTSFRNSFILMTSNIGNGAIREILSHESNKIGFRALERNRGNPETVDREIYDVVKKEASNYFSPEFLGRIDKLIVFRPLSRDALSAIFDLEIKKFCNLLASSGIPVVVKFTDEAKDLILNEATEHPEWGARMVEKKLDRHLRLILARFYNRGVIKRGDLIQISLKNGTLHFQKNSDDSQEIIKP